MTPFRFGSSVRELYGVLHMPPIERFRGQAILLCNPLAQEAVRVHRLYRVLAEKLSKEGCSVLRFDYYGTGESGGEDTEVSLGGWQADIISADAELRRRSGVGSSTWVGARLGASIAALATANAAPPPDALVLWEPIADGTAYAREVSTQRVGPVRGVSREVSPPHREDSVDVQGFAVPQSFMDEVSEVHREVVWRARTSRIAIVASDMVYRHWCKVSAQNDATIPPVEIASGVDPFDWCAEEAMDTEIVPRKVIESLMLQSLR